jgi:hypothetical protein
MFSDAGPDVRWVGNTGIGLGMEINVPSLQTEAFRAPS